MKCLGKSHRGHIRPGAAVAIPNQHSMSLPSAEPSEMYYTLNKISTFQFHQVKLVNLKNRTMYR